jgi:hypothetical protein
MASGRCTAVIAVGTYNVSCPCSHGEFKVPPSTPDAECKKCEHSLSQHEDASSTPLPGPLPLHQGMVSFISAMSSGAVNDMF